MDAAALAESRVPLNSSEIRTATMLSAFSATPLKNSKNSPADGCDVVGKVADDERRS